MKYDLAGLDKYVEQQLARKSKHPTRDIWCYNYTEKAQYGGELKADPFLQKIRGLIVDSNGVVVARGFNKFFNHGECPEVDAEYAGHLPAMVMDKLDGSLGIAYGPTEIATRGSFTSEQAIWASELVRSTPAYATWFAWWFSTELGLTPCFEIIYPDNRIVVSYDFADIVLLGFVDRFTGMLAMDFEPEIPWVGRGVAQFPHKAPGELKAEDVANREGYVLVYSDGRMVKVKFETYLRLHKVMTEFSPKHVLEHLIAGTLNEAIEICPDEFHAEVMQQAGGFRMSHLAHVTAIRDIFDANKYLLRESKKAFALAVKDNRYAAALFGLSSIKTTADKAAWDYVVQDFERGLI